MMTLGGISLLTNWQDGHAIDVAFKPYIKMSYISSISKMSLKLEIKQNILIRITYHFSSVAFFFFFLYVVFLEVTQVHRIVKKQLYRK